MVDDQVVQHPQVLDGILHALGIEHAAGGVELLAGGSVNVVVLVRAPRSPDLVVRYPKDLRRSDEFPGEAWAIAAAARAGVPVPVVVARGSVDDVPYLVLEHVAARDDVTDPWRRLGEYAHQLAGVGVTDAPDLLFSRFGRDLGVAWEAHVDYNVAAMGPGDPLVRDGAYDERHRGGLQRAFDRLATATFTHGLAHGDLAPRNLVPRGDGLSPVLIDWGTARTGPSPWTDAQRVFEWAVVDRSVSEADLAGFLDACGVGSAGSERLLADLTALRLVDTTRWAADHRPDLYPDHVEQCRAGLAALGRSGAIDLP